MLFININIALSGSNLILFLIIVINCPIVSSRGTKNLVLSILLRQQPFAFPTITGILSGYLFINLFDS